LHSFVASRKISREWAARIARSASVLSKTTRVLDAARLPHKTPPVMFVLQQH
jgi:hypothetical protein